jgi:4'-phosphopantetheinyl transferase
MTPGIALGVGDVHVWSATSTVDRVDARVAWNLLTADERTAARRFRDDADRVRRVQARAALRLVLAGYVGVDPEALGFCEGSDGKPALVARPGDPPMRFNVTHSGSVILIAVTVDRELGVDVERVRSELEWKPVAGSFFSSTEVAAIQALPAACHLRAFFDCWVRKEAYLKGLGTGLSRSPREFVVPLGPTGGPVHDPCPPPGARTDWRVHPLEVTRGHTAALAVTGEVRVTCRPLAQLIEPGPPTDRSCRSQPS